MKKIFFTGLLAVVIFVLFSSLTIASPPSVSNSFDANALDAAVTAQMAKHGLPGVALAVINKGEVIYQKGYGVDGNGDPMTPQTKVYIGSQSKSFTALAIAQLAEQGTCNAQVGGSKPPVGSILMAGWPSS